MTKIVAFAAIAIVAWVLVGKFEAMSQGIETRRVAQIDRALGR